MPDQFLFISAYALSPPLLRVAELIIQKHRLEGHVIAPEEMAVSRIYHPAGKLSAWDVDLTSSPLQFHFVPAIRGNALDHGFNKAFLKNTLRRLSPDYIWVHDEFTHSITLQILQYYRFNRRPRIIAYVAQNHTPGPHPLFYPNWPFISRTRLKHLILWPRLNGVAACATKSLECARRLGLPRKVPILVNYHPVFGPEEAAPAGASLPWSRDDGAFIVGFAGEITEQKGWKVLLQALARLPENFKVVLVGDGDQRGELQEWLKQPHLSGQAHFTGPLPHQKLLATYPQFDVVVLPSITTPHAVEQFGRVLAEAMAWEVPVIGSRSGAIPETIGKAGLVVPEGDSVALAAAIGRLASEKSLQRSLGNEGFKQYLGHYRCEVYCRSLGNLLGLSPS